MKLDPINRILDKHNGNRGSLISILGDIQAKYSYLPQEALKIVAEQTGKSLTDIYGVATFYKSFKLTPRGKHLVFVCLGTACHVRNAPLIVEEFERQLGIRAGQTTSDKEFTLETVACLGACALGPIVVVDGHYFAHVDNNKVKKIIRQTRTWHEKLETKPDDRCFPVDVSCPRCNHRLLDTKHLIDDFPSIRVTVSFERKHGWLRLSSLYGSYSIISEYEIPEDTIVNFFCPHCHAELKGKADCAECGAPLVNMFVQGGGVIEMCSRKGCKAHMLDLNGVNL